MIDWILLGKLIYNTTLLLSCVFVIRYGGVDERAGMLILVVGGAATAFVRPISIALDMPARFAFVAVDILALILFDQVMIRSRKFWPIWLTGIQLAAVLVGLAMLAQPQTLVAFRLIQGKFAYGMLVAMLIGAEGNRRRSKAEHMRQRRAIGENGNS